MTDNDEQNPDELTTIRVALNSISDAIIIFDEEDRIVAFNNKQLELFPSVAKHLKPGLKYRDLLKLQIESGQIESAIGREEEWIEQRVQQHQNPDGKPIEQIFADGRIIRLTESRTPSGGYVALRTDITELRLAEERRKASEARYRRLFDYAGVAMWDEDLSAVVSRLDELRAEGVSDLRTFLKDNLEEAYSLARLIRINSVNEATLALYGISSAEEFDQNLIKMVDDDSVHSIIDIMCAIWDGEEQYMAEITHPGMDGTEMTVLIVIPMADADWQHVPVSGIDITARKRVEAEVEKAREAAQEADRAKSQFLANMSHELRTPLNAIIGFSSIIRDQAFGPDATDRYVGYAQDILDSGDHLLKIINDILDLSRIESGKVVFNEEHVHLGAVLKAACKTVADRAEDSDLTMRLPDAGMETGLLGDPRLITQIFLNLLTNAIKFTPRHGEVNLTIKSHGDGQVSISVSDTGVGISEQDMPLVLSTFGQAADAMTRATEGTGLGLPIVLSLMKLHGGELQLQSQPGVGTTATVTFPADRVIH